MERLRLEYTSVVMPNFYEGQLVAFYAYELKDVEKDEKPLSFMRVHGVVETKSMTNYDPTNTRARWSFKRGYLLEDCTLEAGNGRMAVKGTGRMWCEDFEWAVAHLRPLTAEIAYDYCGITITKG